MTTISNTSLEDIHSDIIQTHILPLLDGPSLSNTSSVSSNLQALCSDVNLWSRISKATWPSITDPRVDDVLSTFPAGHRSFYDDSYPSLITERIDHHNIPYPLSTSKQDNSLACHLSTNKLISAVDIRYKNDIMYSRVEVTDTTGDDFLMSSLNIELPGISRSIDLTVDEIVGADNVTLLHLKESLTLNWILIDPAKKRAGNISSIKPVSAKQDWAINETHVRYVTILPGRNVNELLKCRIQVVLGVDKGGVGLHAKEVSLKLEDLDCKSLNGRDFLIIMQGAISEENNVTRKVIIDDEERWKSYKVFREMKKIKNELVKKRREKTELVLNCCYLGILLSFLISLYLVILLLK